MTFIWFLIFLAACIIGSPESLALDPINGWTGTLLFAASLDLGVGLN